MGDESPQLTVIDETVPSGSVAEKVRVTRSPVLAGLGKTLTMLTVGDLSFIITEPVAGVVEPLLSVAVTVMVKL
jgi:hypothetical protein